MIAFIRDIKQLLMTYQIHIDFRSILASNDKCTVPPPDNRKFHHVGMDLHYTPQPLGEEKKTMNKSTENRERDDCDTGED